MSLDFDMAVEQNVVTWDIYEKQKYIYQICNSNTISELSFIFSYYAFCKSYAINSFCVFDIKSTFYIVCAFV